MSKTNVLVVARHLCGGIRTYIDYNYRLFPASSFKVAVVATARGEIGCLRDSLEPLQPEFITTPAEHPVPHLMLAVWRMLRRGTFDLVHAQGLTSGIACLLPATSCRIPLVATHHDVFHEELNGIGGWLKRKSIGNLMRRFDCLIAVSDDSRDNLHQVVPELRRSGVRIETILNGIDTARYRGLRRARPPRPTAARFRLGFLGRFMPQKGFDILVQAVLRLQDHPATRNRVCVVAANDGAFVREYKARVRELGLDGQFEFTGFQASVAEALSELDAVVIPSRWEACPLLPMEALVAGCPVIASDCLGLREVTRGTPALAVKVGDHAELAQSIGRFMTDSDRYEAAAAEYADVAADRFDVGAQSLRLQQLFKGLVVP